MATMAWLASSGARPEIVWLSPSFITDPKSAHWLDSWWKRAPLAFSAMLPHAVISLAAAVERFSIGTL